MPSSDGAFSAPRRGWPRVLSTMPIWSTMPYWAFLTVGLTLFPAGGRDDKYLTYWPAYTLANWGEILNFNGERVEQSSSLLYVLLTATLSRITSLEPPVSGWWLGVVGGLLAIWATGRLAARCEPRAAAPARWVIALSGPFVYWSFSGTEPPIVALTASGFLLAAARFSEDHARLRRSGLLVAAALWLLVRPEAGLVAGAACSVPLLVGIGQRARNKARARPAAFWRRHAAPFATVALLSGFLALWRWTIFESVLPQSAVAKSTSIDAEVLLAGLGYLRLPWLLPLAALCSAGAARRLRGDASDTPSQRSTDQLALFCLAYLGFIVCVGGDWMEGARFVAHVLPLLVAWAVVVTIALFPTRTARAVLAALLLISVAGSVSLAINESLSLPGRIVLERAWDPAPEEARFEWIERANRVQRRDIPVAQAMDRVVDRVRANTSGRVQLVVENAGFVAYYTVMRHFGQVRVLDLHGLSDRTVTHSPEGPRLRRGRFGLMWTHADLFARRGELVLGPEAGPVVAFYNARKPTAWTSEFGFETVYWNRTPSPSGSRMLPGLQLGSSQWIAVRGDAASGLTALDLPGNALEKAAPTPH